MFLSAKILGAIPRTHIYTHYSLGNNNTYGMVMHCSVYLQNKKILPSLIGLIYRWRWLCGCAAPTVTRGALDLQEGPVLSFRFCYFLKFLRIFEQGSL